MILDNIAKKYNTDKSSLVHNYCNKYEKYLTYDRNDELNILELGVHQGASLNTWAEYYPNSKVTGVDILESCRVYSTPQIKIEIGSQNDPTFLNDLIKKNPEFDIILDDGSHLQSDMIFSFETLFGSVKKGGVYIIEDTCCSYWQEFGGGYKKDGSSIEYFKNLIDEVNFLGITLKNHRPPTARREDLLKREVAARRVKIRTDIESIIFLNSIIIIKKEE